MAQVALAVGLGVGIATAGWWLPAMGVRPSKKKDNLDQNAADRYAEEWRHSIYNQPAEPVFTEDPYIQMEDEINHNNNTMDSAYEGSYGRGAGPMSVNDAGSRVSFDGRMPNISASDALTQYRKTKVTLGKRKRSARRNFRAQERPYMITRFQGLNLFSSNDDQPPVLAAGTYGMFPLTYNHTVTRNLVRTNGPGTATTPVSASLGYTCVALPMFAYNLSALPEGYIRNPSASGDALVNISGSNIGPVSGIAGYAIPMYQLIKHCVTISSEGSSNSRCPPFVYYAWNPVRGNCNSRLGAASSNTLIPVTTGLGSDTPNIVSANIEEAKYQPLVQQPMYQHQWSDIGVAVYGGAYQPTCTKLSIVSFIDEYCMPPRLWTAGGSTGLPTESLAKNNIFNRDLDDALDCDLQDNATCGLIAGMPGLTINRGTDGINDIFEYPKELDSATAFWDAHFHNRFGHPLSFSKNRGVHNKKWHTHYAHCVVTPPNNNMNAALHEADGNEPQLEATTQRVHKIFKHFNATHDTYYPTNGGVQTKNLIFGNTLTDYYTDGNPAIKAQNNATIPVTRGSAYNSLGYTTEYGVNTCHIYGNNRRRDQWLLIESENPFQSIPFTNATGVPPFAIGTGFSDTIASYTSPGVGFGESNVTNKYPSFDIVVRSRHNLANNVFQSALISDKQ